MLLERISKFCSDSSRVDGWTWQADHYSAKDIYRKLLTGGTTLENIRVDCLRIWRTRTPFKVKIFSWLFRRGRLLTRVYQARWAPMDDCTCALCGQVEEDIDHLSFTCPIAVDVWRNSGLNGISTSNGEGHWDSLRRLAIEDRIGWRRIWTTSMA